MAYIKGQNLRVLVGDKCIACATSCSVHVSADLEDVSSKDSTGDWKVQECVGKSWDMSVDALCVVSDAAAKTQDDFITAVGTTVAIEFSKTSGDSNREDADEVVSGNAIINDVSVTAANRQNSTYTVQFQGVGALS